MAESLVRGRTLPEAYHNGLIALLEEGEVVDCADWNTTCRDIAITYVVDEPLGEPMISKCFIGGHKELQQYLMEMLDGILDFEIEKGNWEYTYHDRIANYGEKGVDQVTFVIDELKRNPSSRRAVILVRDASDIGSEDPACLQHIQYFVKNGKLECKVLFRSNDACKASFMNAFALIMLQKRIADALGLEMGQYTHRANSFHSYEKDFGLLEGYVKRIQSGEEVTYEYEDDWKEEMEEYIDEILKTAEDLKR